MQFILLLMHLPRSWQRNHLSSFRSLWGVTYYFILFQLVTQCNAKYVECFSAQKDCNKEKNRNSSVVPCKITSSVWLLPSISFCSEFSTCYAWKGIATRKENCNLLFRPSCLSPLLWWNWTKENSYGVSQIYCPSEVLIWSA